MNIREITDTEQAAYDLLALEHGTVFHTTAWTSLFGDRLVRYGVFQKNGDVVAGFSLYKVRILGMTVLRNPPFTPRCGPFFRIEAKNPVAILEARRDILDAMAQFLDNRSHALVSLPLDPGIEDTLPFVWRNFKAVPKYTYILDLTLSMDNVKKNMSPVRRRNITKALRDGLAVRQTTDPAVIRPLILQTFSRQAMHINTQHIDLILNIFANSNNSYMFTTYQGDNPIACCFVVHDRRTAYYLMGGYNSDDKHHGAGALALFEAIKYAKKLGLAEFDFEGSMIPAIERYFRGFGGRLTPYFMVNKAWLPLEMALKCVRRQLF